MSSSRQLNAHGRMPRPCAQQGPQSSVRQVESASALRYDSRTCLPLAQAGAASHAEGDDGCKQRNYKLLHLRPPKRSFNFIELTIGSAGRRTVLIEVGVAVQRGPPFPFPRARSNVISQCRRQAVMRCRMQVFGRACSLCHRTVPARIFFPFR